jgi:hypothetical protein
MTIAVEDIGVSVRVVKRTCIVEVEVAVVDDDSAAILFIVLVVRALKISAPADHQGSTISRQDSYLNFAQFPISSA